MPTQRDTAGHGIDALWAEYKETGERKLRDQLIVHYAPVVKYVAGRVSVGLPRHVDEADLASYGIIGLIDAIERFEPLRNIKFETYAIPRIKGAIIDELRSIDWVPRSVRAKARAVEQSYSKLEATLHRTPTDAEVAADLEMTDTEFQTALRKISFVGVVALDEVFRGGDRSDRSTLGETLPDSNAGSHGHLRGEGDQGGVDPGGEPDGRTREDGPHPLLLRRPDPGRDRRHPRGDRVPGLPDPHQGGAAAPGQAGRST